MSNVVLHWIAMVLRNLQLSVLDVSGTGPWRAGNGRNCL